MISRITASVLALALCGTPASALGTASSDSAAAQTDPSFAAGRRSRTPHNNEILVWAADLWEDVGYVSGSTGRENSTTGYVETEIFIETLHGVTSCVGNSNASEMRLIIHLDAEQRNRATHYHNNGQALGSSFNNYNYLNRLDIRISIPVLLTMDQQGVTHTLGSDFSVRGIYNPIQGQLEDEVRRAIRRRPPLTIGLTEAERRAANQNPSEFVRGWANIGQC